MDIKKLQEIIDNSELSDPAKDLIRDLIPQADKPEVQEEILKTIDYEIKMNGLVADEAEEMVDQIRALEIKVDAADKVEDEQLKELSEKYEEKMTKAEADVKQSLQYKDNLLKSLSAEEAGSSTQPAEPVQTSQPIQAETIVPAVETPVAQNPDYGGQQYNSAPQPAAFPTAPVMEQQ